MTDEILYTGHVSSGDWLTFIKDCGFSTGAGTYFLAENLPTTVVEPKDRQDLLVFERFSLDLPFEKYTSGRIFEAAGELRWEKQHNNVRVVYLGQPIISITRALRNYGLRSSDKLLQLVPQARFYYLFGTKLEMRTIEQINGGQINGEQTKNAVRPGDFAELRIHRILRYPAPGHVPDKGYVQLQVQEYIDPESGQVQFFRFQGLDEERHTGEESRR
jgi:hypothetical protein